MLTVGRAASTVLLRYFSGPRLMGGFGLINIMLMLIGIVGTGAIRL
jgi:hypothetical protein